MEKDEKTVQSDSKKSSCMKNWRANSVLNSSQTRDKLWCLWAIRRNGAWRSRHKTSDRIIGVEMWLLLPPFSIIHGSRYRIEDREQTCGTNVSVFSPVSLNVSKIVEKSNLVFVCRSLGYSHRQISIHSVYHEVISYETTFLGCPCIQVVTMFIENKSLTYFNPLLCYEKTLFLNKQPNMVLKM